MDPIGSLPSAYISTKAAGLAYCTDVFSIFIFHSLHFPYSFPFREINKLVGSGDIRCHISIAAEPMKAPAFAWRPGCRCDGDFIFPDDAYRIHRGIVMRPSSEAEWL